MAKPNLLRNSFEKTLEEGSLVAKNSTRAIKEIFSPQALFDQIIGRDSRPNRREGGQTNREKAAGKNQSTPLDLKKLEKRWRENDGEEEKIAALRNRLFQRVHSEEKKARRQLDEKEKGRLKKQQEEDQERTAEEEERRRKEASAEIPQGKQRRSIFSRKKVVRKKTIETKPSFSKH